MVFKIFEFHNNFYSQETKKRFMHEFKIFYNKINDEHKQFGIYYNFMEKFSFYRKIKKKFIEV